MGLELRPSLDLRLESPFRGGPVFSSIVMSSEREMQRFLQEYARHETVPQPKGKKTWPALLVSMHKKAQGKEKPLNRMRDSTVGAVDVFPAQEPVSIRRNGDTFEVVNYGRSFEKTAQQLIDQETDPKRKKKLIAITGFIRAALGTKIRVLNHVVNAQHRFLKSADVMDLVPLYQQDVANEMKVDSSTVNRVLNSVELYYGRRPIRTVFLTPGKQYNRVVLTEAIRRIRKKHKTSANKGILSHEDIMELLEREYPGKFRTKGSSTPARRTITKYSPSPRMKRIKREKPPKTSEARRFRGPNIVPVRRPTRRRRR